MTSVQLTSTFWAQRSLTVLMFSCKASTPSRRNTNHIFNARNLLDRGICMCCKYNIFQLYTAALYAAALKTEYAADSAGEDALPSTAVSCVDECLTFISRQTHENTRSELPNSIVISWSTTQIGWPSKLPLLTGGLWLASLHLSVLTAGWLPVS